MGMAVGGTKDGPVSEPNIVPLIDVLLVLIIIFMVITPRTPTGFRQSCSAASSAESEADGAG